MLIPHFSITSLWERGGIDSWLDETTLSWQTCYRIAKYISILFSKWYCLDTVQGLSRLSLVILNTAIWSMKIYWNHWWQTNFCRRNVVQYVISWYKLLLFFLYILTCPDNKVHGANMGPTWVLSAPDGPHAGPRNTAIKISLLEKKFVCHWLNSDPVSPLLLIPQITNPLCAWHFIARYLFDHLLGM